MVELKPFWNFQDEFRGKKVLITGATGFIGGRLAERLIVEQCCEVRALIRSWTKSTWISRYPVDLFMGDVRNAKEVNAAVKDCDFVFHCASGGGSSSEYQQVNENGTHNILNACSEHGIERLVYISSIAVHGTNMPDGANETDEYRPGDSEYADSKIAAEKLLTELSQNLKIDVTVIRPTYVWGPRSHLFTISPIRQMAADTFYLVDEGQNECHAVFIETLIDAIVAAAVTPSAKGKAFIVTDGYKLSWREFFGQYADIIGKPDLSSLSSTSWIVKTRCGLFQSLTRMLETLKGNPAPFWRRVVRRLIKHAVDFLRIFGVMSKKDLDKYSRDGSIDTTSTFEILRTSPRYTFSEAKKITEIWLNDQMGVELGLDNHQ